MSSTNQSVPQALISNAIAALQRGDGQGALAQLIEAERQHPADASIKLNRAMVHRNLGDLPASVQALDAALAIEPYYFLALISKGAVLEQMGHIRHAAKVYGDALRIAPPMEQAPPALQQQLRKARELVDTQSTQLRDHLRERLGELLGRTSGEALGRVNEAVDLMAGVQPEVYHSKSIQLQVPRLPAIPFFERDYFPWLPTLEAATDVIRSELVALLEEGMPGFAPYIQYAAGTPENQFAELNHNERWSSLWLWKDGVAQEEPMARCPETTAVLSELPLADQPGFAPTALFSALAPHTRIPPHTGSTNSRLLVHLPLVLPGPAGFRVGSETREWEIGHAWAFDDTIEHEAWNDADETRVIMIFDIWNPLLSAEERDLVSALLREHSDWMSSQPA